MHWGPVNVFENCKKALTTLVLAGLVVLVIPTVSGASLSGNTGGIVTTNTPGSALAAADAMTAACSKATARVLVNQHKLNVFLLPQPVVQMLCGPFTGPGSKAMAVTIGASTCWSVQGWAVFSFSGGAWKLVHDEVAFIYPLVAIGTDLKETVPVFRSTDNRCNPTGGMKSRIWNWNGSSLTSTDWKLTPTTTTTKKGSPLCTLAALRAHIAKSQQHYVVGSFFKCIGSYAVLEHGPVDDNGQMLDVAPFVLHWNGNAWRQVLNELSICGVGDTSGAPIAFVHLACVS